MTPSPSTPPAGTPAAADRPARAEATPFRYTPRLADEFERRWQAHWESAGTFVQPNPGEPGFDPARPKFYVLDMFPYPSGAGLHVGHPEGYTATDIVARVMRMRGYNVLHPMGWDAFGLPAEQYAIQTGVHPAVSTRAAIDNFRRQLKRFGFSYDWTREVATIDEGYYAWTQWIFIAIYHSWFDLDAGKARPIADLEADLAAGRRPIVVNQGAAEQPDAGAVIPGPWADLPESERRRVIDSYRLAYVAEQTVNWCPRLGTALANEEVIDGKSERGGHPVFRKPLKQWQFRITAYAQRLLAGLEGLDWPASTKAMQTEWIGRSDGADLDFPLVGGGSILVFTTRPDTIYGATFMVIAPEHPLAERVLRAPPAGVDGAALRACITAARNRSDTDRQGAKDKLGADTGLRAINPATGEEIPVFVAGYVLMGYGHGAIMAVPAHDERDFDFARAHRLPIRDVVYPRPLLAMRYFARAASAPERADEVWFSVLADFLGAVTTASAGPERFGEILELVRTRRGVPPHEPAACALDPIGAPGSGPGVIGRRRGLVKGEWLDTIEATGSRTFEQFADRFARAREFEAAGGAYPGPGYNANSRGPGPDLDGLPTAEARDRAIAWAERAGVGRRVVKYRLRDWVFSRQRYWGEPIPVVFDDRGHHHAVAESALPLRLPPLDDYRPVESDDPRPLLAKARAWVRTTAGAAGVATLPPETPVTRETNTMPGWAGSCWYYLRYTDAACAGRFASRGAEAYWVRDGVDLYIGGAEHAVLHLLYARFWHKVLYDLGHVSADEPFRRLFHQGLITSYAYQRDDGSLVAVDEVEDRGGSPVERATGRPVRTTIAKMSKSLKNVVNPDDVIAEHGADTFRLYEMYMGPLDVSKPWNPRDITGLFRFLQRAWRLVIDESTGQPRTAGATSPDASIDRLLHRTIAKVGGDIDRLAFNTAIAALIEFVNAALASPAGVLTRDQAERLVLALSPFTPHVAEEMWRRLGHDRSLAAEPWPAADESKLRDDSVELPVQIGGKVRARITVPADATREAVQSAALADPRVAALLAGATVAKVVVVPGKMVSIVTR